MSNIVKTSLLILLCAIASGCGRPLPQVDSNSLLLDTQAKLLCLNSAVGCRALDLIVANNKRNEVLQHWPLDRWNWTLLDNSTKLAHLLLTPPDSSYIITPQQNGRYRISLHPAALDAWRALDTEYRARYPDK